MAMTYTARAETSAPRKKRRARQVTSERLERWASHHLVRHSSSAANLKLVLMRRVRRVEAELETEFPEAGEWIDQVVGDLVTRGYLDDRTYALQLARQMRSRGSSGQRIQARLYEKGVSGGLAREVIEEIAEGESGGDFEAALRYARRRRLGPYRADPEERRERRERDLAALGRSGFSYDVAARIIDAEADS
jgi:regulatory protein